MISTALLSLWKVYYEEDELHLWREEWSTNRQKIDELIGMIKGKEEVNVILIAHNNYNLNLRNQNYASNNYPKPP